MIFLYLIQNTSLTVTSFLRDHLFSTYEKLSKKGTFRTARYANVRVCVRGWKVIIYRKILRSNDALLKRVPPLVASVFEKYFSYASVFLRDLSAPSKNLSFIFYVNQDYIFCL